MKYLFFFISSFILFSCATPSERFIETANKMGFQEVIVNSDQFNHRIYINKYAQQQVDNSVIHVYLDSDGTPWENHRWITDDPSPRNHLVLRMMKQDPVPAILLGRPCYLGFSQSTDCHDKYWTSHRYSHQVVSSMTQVLNAWIQSNQYSNIVLIGYSGGGTLAMLMAPAIKSVDTVLTIAANLDIVDWSQLHGYSPLFGSLNPADYSLPKDIKQFHLFGGNDNVVPKKIVKKISKKNSQAEFVLFTEYNHHCCWDNDWSGILTRILKEY
ncbi:MAG: dienelactone hydrolase family protein [Methylococcales bacterium]|nr:dienelactone hydrolase family protein [Methylococcales bacterium]